MLRRTLSVVLAVTLLFGLSDYRTQAQSGAAEYVALVSLLQQLRGNLDAVLNTANQSTADRIRQIEIVIDNTIKSLQATIKQVEAGVNVQREEAFRQVFDTLALANTQLQSSSRLLFVDANTTLVQAATIVNSLPFVKVPDYIFAAEPSRLAVHAGNRIVQFYGHFPNVNNDGDAWVELDGKTYPLKRYAGFKLAFELPASYLEKEERHIDMTVRLPRPTYFTLYRPAISARLYVEKAKPFSMVIRSFKDNPDLWKELDSPNTFKDGANSSNTSIRRTLKATDLFSQLINDDKNYVMSTAEMTKVPHQVTPGGKPCDCCDAPGGALIRWQASELEYSLSAPTCGDKWCRWDYHCGGGGTNVEIYITPSFRVKKRNVPETVVAETLTAQMGRNESRLFQLAAGWTSLEVTTSFQDGDEKLSSTVMLKPDDRVDKVATTPLFTARRDAVGALRLETRY